MIRCYTKEKGKILLERVYLLPHFRFLVSGSDVQRLVKPQVIDVPIRARAMSREASLTMMRKLDHHRKWLCDQVGLEKWFWKAQRVLSDVYLLEFSSF